MNVPPHHSFDRNTNTCHTHRTTWSKVVIECSITILTRDGDYLSQPEHRPVRLLLQHGLHIGPSQRPQVSEPTQSWQWDLSHRWHSIMSTEHRSQKLLLHVLQSIHRILHFLHVHLSFSLLLSSSSSSQPSHGLVSKPPQSWQ
jgi:hypothetical protein